MRNTFKYAARQHSGQVTKALKNVYQAPNPDAAGQAFGDFAAEWGGRYPAVIRLWRTAWEDFTPFLPLPVDIRRLVYTTDAIESLNARFRQVTRYRRHFPDVDAAMKVLYLVVDDHRPNRAMTSKTSG